MDLNFGRHHAAWADGSVHTRTTAHATAAASRRGARRVLGEEPPFRLMCSNSGHLPLRKWFDRREPAVWAGVRRSALVSWWGDSVVASILKSRMLLCSVSRVGCAAVAGWGLGLSCPHVGGSGGWVEGGKGPLQVGGRTRSRRWPRLCPPSRLCTIHDHMAWRRCGGQLPQHLRRLGCVARCR
jgi:hypothetical protein